MSDADAAWLIVILWLLVVATIVSLCVYARRFGVRSRVAMLMKSLLTWQVSLTVSESQTES